MIPDLPKPFIIHYYHLSGNGNRREFPSGLKARRAFIKMATKLSVAICNHRYKGTVGRFPTLKIGNLYQSVALNKHLISN